MALLIDALAVLRVGACKQLLMTLIKRLFNESAIRL